MELTFAEAVAPPVAEPLPAHHAAPPVNIGGVELRARKRFVDGTHRCASPEETLERIRPHFRTVGLTRLADITGLDRIGVTTVISYRPNSRTLATSAGKGFTRAAAMVSGAMEAIELYHSENVRLPVVEASYRELESRGAVIPLERLPLSRRSVFRVDRPEFWVAGWDLLGQREVFVPYSTVSMVPHPRQRPMLSRPFTQDSNGLASGNHLLEATCAALLEVIERDAVTIQEVCERRHGRHLPRVDLATVRYPLVRELVERFERADTVPVLYDCTLDTAVPTYMATLYDRQSRHLGMAGGYGAHLDPEIAMIRALTEAAQSRLIWISGARDDIFRHQDRHAKLGDNDEAVAKLQATPAHADAGRPSESTPSFEGDVAVLLRKLRAVGIEQAIVVDLSHEEIGIPVVRVVVPGLEGYLSPQYTPGPRAGAFCRAYLARAPR